MVKLVHRAGSSNVSNEAGNSADGSGAGDRVNATLHAYLELKRRIQEALLEPGKTYLQQALAETLEVSRTPVREAVIRLAEEGLVEIRPRYGVYICPLSLKDLGEILDMLAALEVHAAQRVCAGGINLGLIAALESHHRSMLAATEAKDPAGWHLADRAFHRAIMDAAGNRLACNTADGLKQRLSRAIRQMRRIVQIPAASNGEHALLLDGIRKGDGTEAAARMLQHRTRSATDVITLLERKGVLAL